MEPLYCTTCGAEDFDCDCSMEENLSPDGDSCDVCGSGPEDDGCEYCATMAEEDEEE